MLMPTPKIREFLKQVKKVSNDHKTREKLIFFSNKHSSYTRGFLYNLHRILIASRASTSKQIHNT